MEPRYAPPGSLGRPALVRRVLSLLLPLLLTVSAGAALAEGPAPAPEAAALLDEAYRRKAAHDPDGAAAAFARARAAGADDQRVSMELGYLALSRGDVETARDELEHASRGPDADMARRARAEVALLPDHGWVDLYAEAYGWERIRGASRTADLVPMVRFRALYRPVLSFDFNFYAFAQATRDVASRGASSGGLPVIYADDYALLGYGLLLRVWGRRIGLFAQVGPAIDLLDDGRSRVALDARGGPFFGAETAGCAPDVRGVSLVFIPCAEGYAEAVYVSRFAHNVVAFGRARASFSYLVTGPVAWQLVAEGRVAKDRNDDFYNNFADGGAGPRFRLVRPFRLDLMLGVHGGSYFGLQNVDPAPHPLGYVDLRLQAATYVEF